MTDKRHVLQQILNVAELGNDACAAALDLSPQLFGEMLAGQREIPASMLPLIAAVMGVSEAVLASPERAARSADVVPAIWYKLRGNELKEADRQYVLALRQFAFYQHELEQLTDTRAVGWKRLPQSQE